MNHADSSSVARILASSWQRPFNTRSRLKFWLQLALFLCLPIGLYAFSEWLGASHPVSAPTEAMARMIASRQHHQSLVFGVQMLGSVLLIGWVVLVGNVMEQNRTSLARLVPGHVGRLRSALLAAYAAGILAAVAIPGFVLDASLAWACLAAVGMALATIALRSPMMWAFNIALPVSLPLWLFGDDHVALREALWSVWQRHDALLAVTAVIAGAVAPAAVVRDGGTRSLYERGRAMGRRFARPLQPGCATNQSSRMSGAYVWWMARLLARDDSSVGSRLLLGFGPASHWVSRIREGAWFVVVGGGVCAAVVALAAFLGRDLRGVLPWLSFSLLTGATTPALQAAAQLYRTQREQALLALLPGVPRGAALNRWLGWQMTLLFLASALFAFVLAGALDGLAELLSPGLVQRSGGGDMTTAICIAILPQVAWQWRIWSRQHGDSALEFLPSIASFLLGGVAMALHAWAGFDYVPMGVAFMALALAFCAWRWSRMGGEPTAMPIGRLAR